MQPIRLVLRFVLILALAYGALLGLMAAPGVTDGYARAARGLLNSAFRSFRETGLVRFEPAATPGERMDTVVTLRVRARGVQGSVTLDTRLMGYLPAAEACALILASPIALRRKLWALLAGMALCHVMLLARVWCALAYWFASQPEWGVIQVGGAGRKFLLYLYEFTTISPAVSFVGPVFIWIIVCIRRKDLQRWLGPGSRGARSTAGSAPARGEDSGVRRMRRP